MADNRKYYYLKLKESFFDGDSIVLLESMPDGILFSNILMKLYLKSLKNGGKLQLDEHIPYTAQMIATLTRHQIGTVERAIKVFLQLGLVEQLDGGLLYMTDIELMIGQSSTEGERKRAARRENRALLPQRTNVGHLSDIRPPEIEKEIEIELEKEREREEGQSAPAVFGKYQNVFLTDSELAELKEEISEKWEYYIDRLSGYIASTGKKYQNHAATILRWAADDTAKAAPKQGHTGLHLQGGRELMKNELEAVFTKLTTVTPEQEDYTGEDGLLYCGKCRTPKEAYHTEETRALTGHDKRPSECDCQRAKRLEREAAEQRRKHLQTVDELKQKGFTDPKIRKWTFENDNGRNPQMDKARFYADNWEAMRDENIGYLFWGSVGTGKSYLAACIANALMEQEIPVRMTNFAAVLNDLNSRIEGRNEYISRLCRYPLLIIDDFGMERGTEYGLEQVYNVIDSRCRSGKPLIVTTNLSLAELQNPQDTPHARIYDRLLEMCCPVCVSGENFRRENAAQKMDKLKMLMEGKESR